MTGDQIIAAVRAELRRGGRPMQRYFDGGAAENLPEREAASLTAAILLNQEDRILAIEAWISLSERAAKQAAHEEGGHDGWVEGCPACGEQERAALRAMGE